MSNHIKLLKSNEIGQAIINCSPQHIAVAYVGIDWKEFIDPAGLDGIIISPTVGTNPYAIESLVEHISWNKIFFLKKLHAKMYIGIESVVIGSPNLSNNGLSVSGLEEVAISTKNKKILVEAYEYYNELLESAKNEYPTIIEKEKRLSELKIIWSKAVRSSLISNDDKSKTSIMEYSPLSNDDFYIVWYQPYDDYEYSEQVDAIKGIIEDEMHFLESDDVKTGKWILSWRITNKNKPHKTVKPYWIFIDDIFSNAISTEEEYDYTKIAIERSDRVRITPPFDLDKTVITAFNKVISKKKYASIFCKDPFVLENTYGVFEDFISDLKKETETISNLE